MTVLETLRKLQHMYKGRKLKVVHPKWGTIVYEVLDIWAIGDEGAEYFEFIYEKYTLNCPEELLEHYGEDEMYSKLEVAAQNHLRYWMGQPDLVAGFSSKATHEYWKAERKKYRFLDNLRILYGTEAG